MSRATRAWTLGAIAVAAASAACSTHASTAAAPDASADAFTDFEGESVTFPWGKVYVTSKLDDAGLVDSLSFVFPVHTALPKPEEVPSSAKNGLPVRVAIDMHGPVADQTIFRSIAFYYSPLGAGGMVYGAPMWDVHTYIRSEAEVQAIDCTDKRTPPNEIMPENWIYMPPPDNCVPAMGIHGVNTAAPEYNQQRLTISHLLTFYGGMYNGHVLVATLDTIGKWPHGTYAVPVVHIPERPGVLTPRTLDVQSDVARGTVTFTYKDFIPAPL